MSEPTPELERTCEHRAQQLLATTLPARPRNWARLFARLAIEGGLDPDLDHTVAAAAAALDQVPAGRTVDRSDPM